MSVVVARLFVHPIKSCQASQLSQATVELKGLVDDRRFVLVNNKGVAVTGRTHPALTKVVAAAGTDGLVINAPGMDTLCVNYADFSQDYVTARVWASVNQGQHCDSQYDQWFSQYLNYPVHLVFFGEKSSRQIKDFPQPVSFADGYPLLLTNTASLVDLNQRATQRHQMAQFRPNVVIEGAGAFAEDGWGKIRIGEVEFLVHSPCSRCKFTQLNLQTDKPHPAGEPLSVLNQYRKGADGKVYFGQNIIPLNAGVIKTGDSLEVLETKSAPIYATPSQFQASVRRE